MATPGSNPCTVPTASITASCRHLERGLASPGQWLGRQVQSRNKSTRDLFLQEKPEDVERIKQMELDVHKVFIDWVKARRGDRLKAAYDELFTGEFWSGVRGLELGLVDALGDLRAVLRERGGD